MRKPSSQKRNVREQLREGAIVRAEQDRQLAEEWLDLENEALCIVPEFRNRFL